MIRYIPAGQVICGFVNLTLAFSLSLEELKGGMYFNEVPEYIFVLK